MSSSEEEKDEFVPDVSSDESPSPRREETQPDTGVNVTSQDLFGDADDISTSESEDGSDDDNIDGGNAMPSQASDSASQTQRYNRATMEDDDDGGGHGFDIEGENQLSHPDFPGFPDDDEDGDGEGDIEPVTNVIEADMPIFPTMMSEQISFVKMPNFLSVEQRAFDPELYDEEIDEEELQDEEGRSRLKLKIENTIRWRYAKDASGDTLNEEGRERESNARIVRWSDGSTSLLLGSEVFDIHQTPLGSGDFSHLFVQQGTGLQGQAVFRNKLTFRPHSTDSHTHRKITMSIADRLGKTQKIRVLPVVGKDPDAHRTAMMKKEEDRLRSAVRLENMQRRSKERSYTRSRPTVNFLEGRGDDDDDDDDETSISAIKRSVASGKKSSVKKSHSQKSKPKKQPKKRSGSGSSEEEEEEDEDADGYDDGDGFIDDGDEDEEEAEEMDEDDAQSTSEEEAPAVEKPKKRKAVEKDSPTSEKKKKKVRSKNIISSSEDDSD
ncbi:RNA polymerase-associated protein LEO1-like [Sycon ciliatum]|uniref:RNA polymerase-associated protein LEO1-like n=1 Tax=Sycon ciliatum TaxID=27933 RepID=UPI0020AB7CBB